MDQGHTPVMFPGPMGGGIQLAPLQHLLKGGLIPWQQVTGWPYVPPPFYNNAMSNPPAFLSPAHHGFNFGNV